MGFPNKGDKSPFLQFQNLNDNKDFMLWINFKDVYKRHALSVMQRRFSDKAGYVSAVCRNCVVNLILSFLQQISGL